MKTHGKSRTKEYRAWVAMKARCYSRGEAEYYRYGGRGIRVSDEWMHDFPAFLRDVGFAPTADHSIDRINNDGDYEKGNVRWANLIEQGRNRSCNRIITALGETKALVAWSEDARTSVGATTIAYRLSVGWPPDKAITVPAIKGRKRGNELG